jgi:hypothetical protein
MSDTNNTAQQEVEMLLPWYATGEISEQDRKRVERYLADHPEIANQLELIEDERTASIVANEALGAPAAGSLERLMARVDSDATVNDKSASLFNAMITKLFSPGERMLQLGAIAAVVVIMVQAVVIGALVTGPQPSTYETASEGSGQQITSGARLLIAFSEDASAGNIAKLLSEVDARIVDGPRADGIYEIRLVNKDLTPDQVDELVTKLRSTKDLIRFAEPLK